MLTDKMGSIVLNTDPAAWPTVEEIEAAFEEDVRSDLKQYEEAARDR